MKKGFIFTAGLALVLGCGVAVGAHSVGSAKEVGAVDAATEIYLDVSGCNWFSDSAKVAIWNHQGSAFEEFTEDVESGLYKATLSTACTSFNLFRGSALNWDYKWNQSDDASFEEGKNKIIADDYVDNKMKFHWGVYPESEPVYTYTYKGFDPVALTLDDTDKPEGVVHQYTAEVPYVRRSEEIKFFRDGVEITDHIGVDDVDNNNLYGNTTDGFRFYSTYYYGSGTATIYLKTYSDGGISLWGEGRSELSFTSFLKNGSGGGITADIIRDEDYEPNETYIEQYYTPGQYTIKALAGTDWDSSFNLMCSGLAESVTPEPGATNNARQAFQSSAWKVHNDCIENIYLKVKRSDLSLWIYVGGYEEAHVLTIGGQNVPLTKVDENEYRATGVNLSSGDAVTSYTIDGEPVTVTSKRVANNNLKENKTILANVNSADIYYNVSDQTLWVSGLPAAGQHLLKNGNTAIEMNHTDPYEGYDQYASGMVTFAANDTIKVLDTGADDSYAVTWCPSIVATSPALAGKFVYDSENQQMKCTEACSAAVYLKIKSGVDEVYFGDVPEYVTEAVDFVNGFKTALGTACSAEGKKAAVEEAWAAQATAFSGLSDQAKAEVKLGSYSIVDEIIEFGERYVAIKEQHSDWNLENFLEWDLTPSGRHGFIDNGTDAVSSASIIAIISVVSVLSISAIIVLVAVKKRKHN